MAISREDSTSSQRRHRRSQLIPRARLIQRSSFKDRYKKKTFNTTTTADSLFSRLFAHTTSYENLTVIRKKPTSTVRDYIAQPQTPTKRNKSKGGESEADSLDSKGSIHLYRISCENLADAGLSLPNYYPDSRYDTDNTDNVSGIDNVSVVEEENVYNNYKSLESLKDKTYNELYSYDDNIVLTTNSPLYDILKSDSYYRRPSIPRTLRGTTPYDNYFSGKPQSLPVFSDTYLSDLSFSDEELHEKHANTEPIYDRIGNNSIDIYETDNNVKEDKQESKESKYNTHSDYVEENPLYDEVPILLSQENNVDSLGIQKETEQNNYIEEISITKKEVIEKPNSDNSPIKLKVNAPEQTSDYKTIVTIEAKQSENETLNKPEIIRNETEEEKKQHSHNYLKELFESQKGSKKPLQNFISKKISRAFGEKSSLTRRNSKLSASDPNLSANTYCSLPDANASKNLRKCEKIDRKLRKFDQNTTTHPESRFIVNIGRHFDVTANANIPVDFEVKISKVPKAKGRKGKSDKKNDEKSFLEAVKSLKDTLSPKLDNLEKPAIIEVVRKKASSNNKSTLRRSNSAIDNISVKFTSNKINKETKMTSSKTEKEFQEKLGSVRNYWGKMMKETNNNEDSEDHKPSNKIVDVQSKVEDVIKKFEPKEDEEKPPSIVQMTKQIFEPKHIPTKSEKISPLVKEACGIFENPYFERQDSEGYESLNPSIVEIIQKEENVENKASKVDRCVSPIKVVRSKVDKVSKPSEPEFDHVRYKVIKSDLFQKKIFAKCEMESQFDGLMQYLQDYSFQELLIDNNIVIIEPIRTKIPHESSKACQAPHNVTPLVHKSSETISTHQNSGLRRHFFYHPIRVNKEVNDDELPNPDTVKQVRQFFETRFKRPRQNETIKELSSLEDGDPDKDRCSDTMSGSQENLYDSLGSDQQYVSEDVLEKIREYGTSITYYGGRVLNKRNGQPSLTKAIMDEIKGYEERDYECKCRKEANKETNGGEVYQGLKFKLLKSNSCSSRLELVGTNNLTEYRKKFFDKQKQLIDEHNEKNKSKGENDQIYTEKGSVTITNLEKHQVINEKIKRNQPKIVGSEMKSTSPDKKMMQWNEKCDFSAIQFNNKCKSSSSSPGHKINYDYHINEKISRKPKQINEMEFEPYEIASS